MDAMDPEKYRDFLVLWTQQQSIFEEAIKIELHQMIDDARVRGQAAADQLAASYNAWLAPQDRLSVVEAEILKAEDEIQAREDITGSDDDIGDKVFAAALVTEWRNQLILAHKEQAQIEEKLAPLHAEYQKAKDKLDRILEEMAGIELNLKVPFVGYGKQTHAYRIWLEFGGVVPELLTGSGVNYEAGRRFLEELCVKTEVYVAKEDTQRIMREEMELHRKTLGNANHSVHSDPLGQSGAITNHDNAGKRNVGRQGPNPKPVRDYMDAHLPDTLRS